ncbi:ribonuclease toxin HepT-like protein [Thermincola ferriacetica]
MTGTLLVAVARIKKELVNLEELEKELVAMIERGPAEDDFERKRAFASLLHDFYTCTEKIFQTVAKNIDEYVPVGENWHKALLEQMVLSLDGKRPPVISEKLMYVLTSYLVFRHRVRNIYGFQLEWERMEPLIKGLPGTVHNIKTEINLFVKIIEEIALSS